MSELDLPLIFAILMGGSILAYVVLDGFDLGVGMLMPGADAREQELMVASIGPFWDANETWLVMGVGLLLVAFPAAHGVVLQELYLPVAAMLIGLMLRGVAFEFRMKALGWHRELWNWLFCFGSFLAAFAQGFMLARYITGFASGFGPLLFDLIVAAGVCGGYVLLGATWLVMKTEGVLQRKATLWALWGLAWVALLIALVSIATPVASETVRARWFTFPQTLGLMLFPVATAAALVVIARGLLRVRRGDACSDRVPFIATVVVFVFGFAGLAYSLFPYVVMDRMTIWEAAAHPSALGVVLVGAAVVIPCIIGYSVFAYRVFGGKVRGGLYE